MLKVGDCIYSDKTNQTYYVTWVSEKVSQAECGFATIDEDSLGDVDSSEFFIKRLINMRYPTDKSIGSEESKARKRKICDSIYEKRSLLYESIENSCGEDSICVPIIDYFREDTFYYIVYRRIKGYNLNLMDLSGLPLKDKYRILLRLVQSLSPLHNKHIVHGDLKPDNILVKKDEGNIKLHLIDMDDCYDYTDLPQNGTIIGTPDYYSPELAAYNDEDLSASDVDKYKKNLTTKSDIFALGIIFCEFFAGKRPIIVDSKDKYVYEAVSNKGIVIPDSMPNQLRDLIKSMLDKDYRKRPDLIKVADKIKRIREGKEDDDTHKSFGCDVVVKVNPSDKTAHTIVKGLKKSDESKSVEIKTKKIEEEAKTTSVKGIKKPEEKKPYVKVNNRKK